MCSLRGFYNWEQRQRTVSFLAEDNSLMWINAGDQCTMNILSPIPVLSSFASCRCQKGFLLMHSKELFWDASHLSLLGSLQQTQSINLLSYAKEKNPLSMIAASHSILGVTIWPEPRFSGVFDVNHQPPQMATTGSLVSLFWTLFFFFSDVF